MLACSRSGGSALQSRTLSNTRIMTISLNNMGICKGVAALLVWAVLLPAGLVSCKEETRVPQPAADGPLWTPYDESAVLAANADHPNPRMRFQLVQSRISDKNAVFDPLYAEAMALSPERYEQLRPLILESAIPQLQEAISGGRLTYEELTRFYLRRIYTFELDSARTLHTIVALNPEVVEQARDRDYVLQALPDGDRHPVFGMPVLLKDNIGAEGMPTTAGAIALKDHRPGNAFITSRLEMNGALILGKVNLSEWAYFFCRPCPVGYSAIGGQTLNPYGRGIFETGGSSSGSGTAVAAGYAVAAVGTETSGSILSPSVVGLKPTIGLLSRNGIVPISETLDTPGPMARSVLDAGILMDAMTGYDSFDPRSLRFTPTSIGSLIPTGVSLEGKRLGVYREYLKRDSLYREATDTLREAGAELVLLDLPADVHLEGFVSFLSGEMKRSLPAYLALHKVSGFTSVADIRAYNAADSALRAPYGQQLFDGIVTNELTDSALDTLRKDLRITGRDYFSNTFEAMDLDAVLSVDNRHAGLAATAEYPALGVPMGFRADGEPANLTFISKPFREGMLLSLGHAFEALGPFRRPPAGYQ